MEEKKYLKGWQKVAYGAGDFGSNFMYTFVSSFVLIYLTVWLAVYCSSAPCRVGV